MATEKQGALILGGDYRALTVVRSLGRRGVRSFVLSGEQAIAATSRYASGSKRWPEEGREEDQVRFLLSLARISDFYGWMLFPTTDEHAALIARNEPRLARTFSLATSPWGTFRYAYDKRLSYELAGTLGIPHPRTWYPETPDDVARLDCQFPVILKPAAKVATNALTEQKAWRVDDRKELIDRYREATGLLDARLVMVQEMIPGDGTNQYSFAALCSEGEPLATLSARRRRQFPIEFGRSSSFVESVDEPEVEASARLLIDAIRFTGLIEAEFKRDPRDGKFKLLDLNPRVWGWTTLGRAANVDFPYLFWRMSRGERIERVRGAAGKRWVRMVTDVPAAIAEWRRGRLSARDYLRSLRRPVEWATFAFDDLAPSLLEVPLLAIAKLKARRRIAQPPASEVAAPASSHAAQIL